MSQLCVQCRYQPAKWQELNRAKNVYCGRICQWEHHLIGLKAGDIDDENIIGLESAHGTVRIEITAEQARKMQTIEHLLEAVGHTDDYIPLPSVSGRSLSQIKHFLDHGRNLMDSNSMSNTDFVNLLQAADYLQYQHLLLNMMREWSERDFVGLENMKNLASVAIYFQRGQLAEKLIPFLSENLRQFYERIRDESDPNSWPISLAALRGDTAAIDYFLENISVDPSRANNFALNVAAGRGHLEAVKRLLQDRRVAYSSRSHNHALEDAILGGHVEITQYLLKHARIHFNSVVPLIRAVSWTNNPLLLDILLQDGRFDPSAEGNRILQLAVTEERMTAVKRLLLDKRVDPSVINWSLQSDAMQKAYAKYLKRRRR